MTGECRGDETDTVQDDKRIANASDILRRTGWSCTIAVFGDPSRPLAWTVDRQNGESRIRAYGKTKADGWDAAVLQTVGLRIMPRGESEARGPQ
jgi:hypothetical protein